MKYVTDAHLEIALGNGISKRNVLQRVYTYDWEIEKAITTPTKQAHAWEGYEEQLKKNGITKDAFNSRIKSGWTKEQAATTPILKMGDRLHAKSTRKDIEEAAANGINKSTFISRIYLYKWPLHAAKTLPVGTLLKGKRGILNDNRY